MSAAGDVPLFAEPRPVQALGDLFANIWQVCWVTSRLRPRGRGCCATASASRTSPAADRGRHLPAGSEPVDWEVRIGMGSRGGLIAELIEPVSGEVEFYRRPLPDDGSFGLRLHHLAASVQLGDEAWESLEQLLASQGLSFDYTVLIPDRVRAGYVDTTAELGHFLEICQLQPADTEFFSGLVEQ